MLEHITHDDDRFNFENVWSHRIMNHWSRLLVRANRASKRRHFHHHVFRFTIICQVALRAKFLQLKIRLLKRSKHLFFNEYFIQRRFYSSFVILMLKHQATSSRRIAAQKISEFHCKVNFLKNNVRNSALH